MVLRVWSRETPQAHREVYPDRVDAGRAAAFAERWRGPRHHDSARTLPDAGGIDVVWPCTPHPQHADPLILVAERGIHGVAGRLG
jgi:predicted dehydrogenase